MLDKKTIEVIQSTIPALEEYGETITTRFYELLFQNHPELYNIFNVIHQKKKEQQRALANAIYQAATHIDKLPAMLPALERIFQKHRSLGVKPEHYPIVGKYLLIAIKDVLGDLATDEIMKAWEDAYGVLASVFTEQEEKLYQQAQNQESGWIGWKEFIVKKKIPESKVITSFYLSPADGKTLPAFKPGQYISLKAPIEELHLDQIRQYSLSDTPTPDYYRISVKREDENGTHPAGIVSTYLHHQIQEGDTVTISAPAGDFYLDTEKDTPVVLISGGVGFTPLMSMLNTLTKEKTNRSIVNIHAAINSEYHAMRDHVQQLTEQFPQLKSYICYEKPTKGDYEQRNFDKEGFIDLPWLKQILPQGEANIYFCGPVPFMSCVKDILERLGVNQERIRYEFFGPATLLETVPM